MVSESQHCQILLVDPTQSDNDVVQPVLEDTGAVVYAVQSGEQAIDVFASRSIDIVITEQVLCQPGQSGINGLELMDRLLLVDHSVQVIFLTQEQGLDQEIKALASGAFDYLRKPIPHAQLLQHTANRAYEFSKLQRRNQTLLLQLDNAQDKLATAESTLLEVKKKYRKLAITDSLTQLYNRRFIEQTLKQEVDRRNRYKTSLSVVFIDIDGFSALCREQGHEASNFVLKDIARLLLQCSRTSDIIGRFAADVFVALLPETTPHNAMVFAERVRSNIESTRFELSGKAANLTVSVGLTGVEVTSGPITDKHFTVAASKALHIAKHNGANQVCAYPDSICEPPGSQQSDAA
jgi:diguanylate cyclase (GGDEF)-like protein